MIDRGANKNTAQPNGLTALMLASDKDHLEIVKLLIEMGADVNAAKVNDIMTALIFASFKGNIL